jgi:outer membrane receptor for ferrienterochelin and colicins
MRTTIILILLFFKTSIIAQTDYTILRGSVKNEQGETIVGAAIQWLDNSVFTFTDSLGFFKIKKTTVQKELKISFVGYQNRKIRINTNDVSDLTIILKANNDLKTLEISAKRSDNVIKTLDPRLVEHISSNELKKAPCCNLSESFETNGSVDVAYTDAITGAKEIQMLGLRGIYTQLLVENRPDFYGIAMPYALEYIPGTWLEGIDINKGASSAKNGTQAITGQINTELEKPGKGKHLFVNLFSENTGRLEANVQTNHKIKEGLFMGLLLHSDWMNNRIDENKDGFVDMPLKKQANGMYRLFYSNNKIFAQLNVQGIKEARSGGHLADTSRVFPFLMDNNTDRLSIFSKLAYTGFNKPYKQLGSQWAVTYHNMNSQYGKHILNGTQRSFYGNVIYSTIIKTTDHKINGGLSYQLDEIKSFLDEKNLSRTEGVLGTYAEYTYSRPKLGSGFSDWTIIAGSRFDYFNKNVGYFTPRLNIKYNFRATHALRFSASRGVRVANPIFENLGLLANNRSINIENDLKPEDAWNIGVNYILPVSVNEYDGRLSIDFFRTQFNNQIIADMETDYRKVSFYNLNGASYANSLMVMFSSDILEGLHFKAVYKLNDVKTTYKGSLERMPLVAKQRGLISMDYISENKKWLFNATTQIIGQQRLINRSYLPPQYRSSLESISPSYILVNLSVNRKFKQVELYGGCENLTGFKQDKPIIAYENPQSIYFDATQIYAPLMGRRLYMGVRCWFD